jgi:hypothetical protein
MKVDDLIEILKSAEKMYKKKHKSTPEIFGIDFDHDTEDGRYPISIHFCKDVTYRDHFNSKSGSKPSEHILVDLEIQDGKIEDRSLEFEEDVYD